MTPSPIRPAARAGQFYEGSAGALERAARGYAAAYRMPADLGTLFGGVAPHAGWMYSGPTAAKVFAVLAKHASPETYVLLGAVHYWHGSRAAAYPSGAWSTPLGQVAIDAELTGAIVEAGGKHVAASAPAHDAEHSIEVQIPFIQVLSPDARIVALAVPPAAQSVAVGEAVAAAIQQTGRKAVVVASTDLTHYGMGYGVPDRGPLPGAMPWMRENDHRMIALVESLKAEEIVPEAEASYNACGPGAVAAAVAAARALGATSGRLLEYTTSADAAGEHDADRAVGYAGLVFERKP